MKGPFYVKDGDKYVLSDICTGCAFGNELGCIILKCIAVPDYKEDEEDEEEFNCGSQEKQTL